MRTCGRRREGCTWPNFRNGGDPCGLPGSRSGQARAERTAYALAASIPEELAARHGAFLILDEAQLAPARTGKMWGFEHYGVVPDMVTFAKGMSAGLAICGVVARREIAEQARGRAGTPWAGTYSGDPLPAAVALKQLEIVERDNLAARG